MELLFLYWLLDPTNLPHWCDVWRRANPILTITFAGIKPPTTNRKANRLIPDAGGVINIDNYHRIITIIIGGGTWYLSHWSNWTVSSYQQTFQKLSTAHDCVVELFIISDKIKYSTYSKFFSLSFRFPKQEQYSRICQ